MISSLLVLHVIVVLLLAGVILIQKSEGGIGLGTGSGAGSMFTARGAANFLTRATAILAAIFLINCLFMGALTSIQIKNSTSFLQKKIAPQ